MFKFILFSIQFSAPAEQALETDPSKLVAMMKDTPEVEIRIRKMQ